MKKRFTALALLLALSLAPAPVAAADAFTPVTGQDMLKNLLLGINIGNTLDARPFYDAENPNWNWLGSNHMATETCWGEPKLEDWHFKDIAQKGFTAVRIPVSWEPHMEDGYNIRKEWMDRVRQCVDWALDAGLHVIINTHHERSSPESLYDLIDGGNAAEAEKYLTSVWEQISGVFKDYDQRLIFEPMNEPYRAVQGGWIWDRWPNVDRNLVAAVNKLNNDALRVIRASGGNNGRRVVMLTVPGANVSAIEFYEPPDDPYTMLGVFVYPYDDVALIKAGIDRGIPMVVKETAPIFEMHGVDDPGEEGKMEWVAQTFGAFSEMGVPSFYWNHSSLWEIYSRVSGEWDDTMVNAIFKAYGKTPGANPAPPPEDPLDSAGAWAREGIASAINKGFVPAEIQGDYTKVITRLEFCRMAVRWVEYATGKDIDELLAEKGKARDPDVFTDTDDPDILAAFALGVTSGTGGGRFTPEGQFSREQAATMIMNACRAVGADTDTDAAASTFSDIGSASDWALPGIGFVQAKGIMSGTGNNRFSPKAAYTREQSIVTFNNMEDWK